MKREEEIAYREKHAEEAMLDICSKHMMLGANAVVKDGYRSGFDDGVKWADETMINKACKWLDKVNTDNYMDSGIFQMSELISDFRKAMKGKYP